MDIYKIKDTLSTKRFRDTFCGVLVVLFITAEMFVSSRQSSTPRLDDINCFGAFAWLLFVMLSFRRVDYKSGAVKVYSAFLLWLIVTRPLCKDATLVSSQVVIQMQILFFCILSFGSSIEKKMKKRLLTTVAIVYCVFYLAISIACIYTAITHNDTQLPFNISIRLMGGYGVNVNLVGHNRNDTAQHLCVALCMALCLSSIWRKNRTMCYLMVVVFYVAVGATHSKTSMIASAVAITMAVIIWLMKLSGIRGCKAKVAATVTVGLILIFAFYKGFSVTDSILNRINADVNTNSTNMEVNSFVEQNELNLMYFAKENTLTAENDKEENIVKLQDNRDKKSVRTLTGRVTIWKAALSTLFYEPYRLICGSSSADYMTFINIILPVLGYKLGTAVDTHNFLVEILMLTGLPGFMLMLTFVLILLSRVIKVYFSSNADLFVKMLTIPIVAKLVIGLCEATLAKNINVTNYIFFLVAGIFLSYSYELFPEKKLWGRRKGKVQDANEASSTAIDEAAPEQTLPEQVTL